MNEVWYDQAFGKKRTRMRCKWTYSFEKKKINEAKDLTIQAFIVSYEHYKYPEVIEYFSAF